MIKSITLTLKSFFSEGHERTIKAKKNIAASFIIKGASIIISFRMVRLTIHYVNPTPHGHWLTLSAVLALFIVILVSVQFVLQLISIIFSALQNTAKVSLMFLVGNTISFIIVLILRQTTQGSLLYLGLSLFVGNLLSLIGFSLWFFNFV